MRKLNAEEPNNSTILSNLGYAWLGLGEKDSTQYYIRRAVSLNPFDPEAKLCGGLMDELNGDPIKADEAYVESFEDPPNPFTQQMAKNNNSKTKLNELDFEKIKKTITIFEYFKKGWAKREVPLLSGDVKNWAGDDFIQKGYAERKAETDKKLEEIEKFES